MYDEEGNPAGAARIRFEFDEARFPATGLTSVWRDIGNKQTDPEALQEMRAALKGWYIINVIRISEDVLPREIRPEIPFPERMIGALEATLKSWRARQRNKGG